MADIEHSTLTGGELHEPKGISTVAENHFYLSDGSGSGTWTPVPTGWANYHDAGSAQVFTTTAAKLSIDGAGANTNTSYLPQEIRGSGDLWDTTNDKITPIVVGDAYNIRLDIPVTAETGSPTEITFQFDIGGGATPSTVIVTRFAGAGKSVPYTISVGFPVFSLSTFVTNGCQIFVSTDSGSVTVTNPSIFLARVHAGGI